MNSTQIIRFLNNYKVKLSCLLIAVLLWLIVVMGNKYFQVEIIPFRIINPPAGHVVSEPVPDGAEVTFTGSGFELLDFRTREKYIELDMRHIDTHRKFRMRTDMIKGMPLELNVKAERVIGPDSVTVKMEPLVSKRVPVSRRFLRLEPMEGYLIVGPPEFEPDTIGVSGPATAVSRIDSVITETKQYSHLIRDLEGELEIVPPPWEGISYSRSAVKFCVDVQRIHERHIYGVPVEVINVPAGIKSVKVDPSVLTLTVHGGVDVVSALTLDEISATIDFAKERHRSQTARAVITIPREVISWSSKPAFFKLRIER